MSLTLVRSEVQVMVARQLFLPARWTNNATSMTQADGPGADRTFRTKSVTALPKVDRVTDAGTRFGLVLTCPGSGMQCGIAGRLGRVREGSPGL